MTRVGTAASALILSIGLMSGAEAAASAGRTNMTFSPTHGTQVEYLGPRGDAHLWYPGNAAVVSGRWKRSPAGPGGADAICFNYQADSYNPATGIGGGHWECEPSAVYTSHVVDSVGGDPFGLGRAARVPFDLPPERTTLAALRAR